METTIWKCACGVLALGLATTTLAARSAEEPGPLRATSLEIVDSRGRVRWRIEGEYPKTHRPKLTLLDERGKERVEMTLGGGVEKPTLVFQDGVVGRPLMTLELDRETGRPSLSMRSLEGQAPCVVLSTRVVVAGSPGEGKRVDVGDLLLLESDGGLPDRK